MMGKVPAKRKGLGQWRQSSGAVGGPISLTRRRLLRGAAALPLMGFLTACGPAPATTPTPATPAAQPQVAPTPTAPVVKAVDPELADFLKADIDWQQAKGETITVLVIPANYFAVLQEITPLFTKLTGINVEYQIIPPLQLREKHILDLSTKAGQFASAATDPMYYPLYVTNGWIEDLGPYLDNPKLTNKEWLDLNDIIPAWLEATKYQGKLYGLPYDGECTIHYYRSDLYTEKGLRPPETLDDLRETARRLHAPTANLYGIALRGFKGPGQNMYIFPSLFRAFGGEWFDKDGRPTVNSKQGVEALTFYVDLLTSYAPSAVVNWNWPEILDAFVGGTIAQFIDASSPAAAVANPAKSKVVGKVAFGRWPKGPAGRRITSIWNWSFPINRAISDRAKVATWLWIQWAVSKPVQIRTSYAYQGKTDRRAGVNRLSLWQDERYRQSVNFGPGFAEVVLISLREDTDPEWRPRVPQWPEIGNIMATAIQKALVKQATPKEALDEANAQIQDLLKKR